MANDHPTSKNLRPLGDGSRTKEEERRIQSEGGKKSGETRRRKRDMKQAAKALLGMGISSKQKTMKSVLDAFGIPEEDANYQMAVLAAQLLKAANGDTQAASFLRDTAGENPQIKMREAELRQKKAEFKYQKEKDAQVQESEDEGSYADTVVAAFEKRMKEENKSQDESSEDDTGGDGDEHDE